MVKLGLALLFCVVGCKKEQPQPAGSGSTSGSVDDRAANARVACTGAVARAISLMHAELAAAQGVDDHIVAKLLAVQIALCIKDGWSDVAVTCYARSTDLEQAKKCDGLLTADQLTASNAAMQDTIDGIAGIEDRGCTAALDHSMPLLIAEMKPSPSGDTAADLKRMSVIDCRKSRWSSEQVSCMTAAKTIVDVDKCDYLTPAQTTEFEADLKAIVKRAGWRAKDALLVLPQECKDYTAAIAKIDRCDKLPAKAALQTTYEQLVSVWQGITDLSREARHALSNACKQNLESLMVTAKQPCQL